MQPHIIKIFSIASFALLIVVATAAHVYYWRYQQIYPSSQMAVLRANVIPITAPINGPIINLYVSSHSLVKRGQPLLQIDPLPYQEGVITAQNNLLRIKEEVKIAENTITGIEKQVEERQNELSEISKTAFQMQSLAEAYNMPAVNPETKQQLKLAGDALEQTFQQLDQAYLLLGKRGVAEAKIKTAQAILTQAKLNLEYTQISAPANGYISQLNVKVGSAVAANKPLLLLIENNVWWVDAVFKPNLLRRIKPNQLALIKLNPISSATLQGVVEQIEDNIVKIKILNPKPNVPLQVGLRTMVTIDTTSAPQRSASAQQ